MTEYYKAFIGGEFFDALDGARMPVGNPATGDVWAEVPACTAADADRAIKAAEGARRAWAALPPIERAGYLRKICDGLRAEREHFARLLVREQGKPFTEALGEVNDTILYMTYAAEAARRIQGEILPSDAPNEQLYIYRVPYGTTLGICAYNYPLALIGRKLGPALVTGNVMILKPHEATPVTGSEPCRIVQAAGVPAGVVGLVTGGGPDLGQALVENEAVLVEEAVAEEFTKRLLAKAKGVSLGDPMTDDGMGPVTTGAALNRIEELVARAVSEGAELADGGARANGDFGRGYYYQPTVPLGAKAGSATMQEEIFGPVPPIVTDSGLDEAISVTNSRPDGLSAYLWSASVASQMRAVHELETGTDFVNKGISGLVQGNLNGHKRSGLGGEDGTHGIEGYLQKRTVYLGY